MSLALHAAWFSGWPIALRDGLAVIAAIAIAELAHFLLYACFRRAERWRPSFFGGLFIRHTSGPAHPLLILLAVTIALEQLGMEDWGSDLAQHILEIGYIAAFTWLTIGLLEIGYAFVVARLPDDIRDDVRGRRIRTQVFLLRQIMIWLLVFIGFAAILMTFPSVRNVGAGSLRLGRRRRTGARHGGASDPRQPDRWNSDRSDRANPHRRLGGSRWAIGAGGRGQHDLRRHPALGPAPPDRADLLFH